MIKRLFTATYIIITLLLICSAPVYVFAQPKEDYTVIAPLPGTTEGECNPNLPTSTQEACKTNLGKYFQALFVLVIGAGAVLSFLLLTYYGFNYMYSDSFDKKAKAKDMLLHIAEGVLLLLGSYIILNTINPDLLNLKLNIPKPNIKKINPINLGDLGAAGTTDGASTGGGNQVIPQNWSSNEQTVRDALKKGGYTITGSTTKEPCATPQSTGCTSVSTMPTDVQNTLIALRQQCCQRTTLTITGGTEQGVHKNSTNTATYGSHGPGGNAVDIAPNPSLTTFITGSSRTPNAGYSTTKNINGKTVRFLYEVADGHSTGPHWHVATF